MLPRDRLRAALERGQDDAPALVAFLTAGFPDPDRFLATLRMVAEAADAVEVGVPFSDPMADGVTIQRSSRAAIERGVTLRWILEQLGQPDAAIATPLILFSYYNPLLAYGLETLAQRAREVGISGFIVPDLPYEESAPLRRALAPQALALVQLVTPATPPARRGELCAVSEGFVYAVTRTGITGGEAALPAEVAEYLDDVKAAARLPVCAGFGVRRPEQVRLVGAHADGVVVGTALVEVLERGEDAAAFLRSLRASAINAS